MHVIIAVLGSIVTILYLLDRIGVDIGWLNPFHWAHRRRWANKYEGDPIYSVEEPLHVAALLIVGAARLDGDLSAEQKQTVLDQFEAGFNMDSKESTELFTSASHLLGGPQILDSQLDGLISRNSNNLSPQQTDSMLKMMEKVASADGAISEAQRQFIDKVQSSFTTQQSSGATWA